MSSPTIEPIGYGSVAAHLILSAEHDSADVIAFVPRKHTATVIATGYGLVAEQLLVKTSTPESQAHAA